jgi:hypothetical protein
MTNVKLWLQDLNIEQAMTEPKYIICWKSKLTGVTGHGEAVFDFTIATEICKASDLEHPELCHWPENDEHHYHPTQVTFMTDPTPNCPPLWRVMADAYIIAHASGNVAHAYAAELRAIADAVEKRWAYMYEKAVVNEIVTWLRDEADRAEAGVTGTVSFDTDHTMALGCKQ